MALESFCLGGQNKSADFLKISVNLLSTVIHHLLKKGLKMMEH